MANAEAGFYVPPKESIFAYRTVGDAVDRTLAYPFQRPSYSYVSDGGVLFELPDEQAGFSQAADNLLAAYGVPLMAERYPVISYGSNANPIRQEHKMNSKPTVLHGERNINPIRVIPAQRVSLPGVQVVWHGKPSRTGSAFAVLYKNESPDGPDASGFVSYLTPQQIALMNLTEGDTYSFVPMSFRSVDGKRGEGFTYVPGKSSIILKDGKPVPVKGLEAVPSSGSMTAEEVTDYYLKVSGGVDDLQTARELAISNANPETSRDTKIERQEHVARVLAELGVSVPYTFPASQLDVIARSDLEALGLSPEERRARTTWLLPKFVVPELVADERLREAREDAFGAWPPVSKNPAQDILRSVDVFAGLAEMDKRILERKS